MQESKWLHSEIPPSSTVMDFIKTRCHWNEAVLDIGTRFEPELAVKYKVDPSSVCSEIYDLYRELGAIAWRSQQSLSLYGISLSFNPSHPKDSWHVQSFGHPRYQHLSRYDYFQAVERDAENRIKDDYLDSLGFRVLIPQLESKKNLKDLFSRFRVPVVRSTARTINGCLVYPSIPGDGGMHRDDSPFEVLRLNFSLTDSNLFGIQYLGCEPQLFCAGEGVVINTDYLHRAYIEDRNNIQRTNLIIGVTPWLSYDAENEVWSLNEHFGKTHPYDLVESGDII